MSLFKSKDLDYLLLLSLSNSDLSSICKTNKYYRQIYLSEYFWKLKLFQDFPELNKEFFSEKIKSEKKTIKEYYFELWKSCHDEDFVMQVFNAIKRKREDILLLIFKRRQLNPNYKFNLRNEPDFIQKNTYVSPKIRGNELFVWGYSPVELCISWSNFEMWKTLISLGAEVENSSLYKLIVKADKKEIFDDLLGRKVPFPNDLLYYAIRCDNLEITEKLLSMVKKEYIERTLLYLSNEREPFEIVSWTKETNISCYTFLSDSRVRPLLSLNNSTLYFKNLLTKYFPS